MEAQMSKTEKAAAHIGDRAQAITVAIQDAGMRPINLGANRLTS
jgi:hypothetical protein